MSATYLNPWHNPSNPIYGPAFYKTDVRPVRYKGYLIYQRIAGVVWDVVKDDRCLTQRAGPNGAREYVDQIDERRNHA